jgi:hypothetical protein
MGGQTHVWNVFPVRLVGVEMTGKPFPSLSFTYTHPGYRGIRSWVNIEVLVPQDKEEEAEDVVRQLQGAGG